MTDPDREAGHVPRLSLIVSTIGRPKVLQTLLRSLDLCHDVSDFELVLVDQSEDQACARLLREMTPPYPVTILSSGRGLSHGRNVGLAHARGAIVAFPDDDCEYEAQTLVTALEHLDGRPELAGVAGRQVTADGADSALRWAKAAQPITRRNYHRTCISSTLFLRRQAAEDAGGFDERFGAGAASPWQAGEESDLVLRLIASGRSVYFDPAIRVRHEDPRQARCPSYPAKMAGYGRGQGFLCATHSLGLIRHGALLTAKLLFALLRLMAGRVTRARADVAFVRGFVTGYRAGRAAAPVQRRGPVEELRSSYTWRFLLAGVGLLATFLMTVLTVRSLSSRDSSVYFSILAALFVGPLLGRLGLGQNAIKELSAGDPDGDVAARSLWTSGAIGLATAPFVAWLSTVGLQGGPARSTGLVLVTLMIVLETLRLTASDIFAGLGHVGWSVAMTHHTRAVLVLLSFGVYLVSGARASLLALLFISTAVGALLLALALARLARETSLRRPRHWGSVLFSVRAGLLISAVDLAAFVIGRGDVWLASYAFSAAEATQYATASVLAFQITVPVGLANVALAPSIARLWESARRQELKALLDATATLSLAFTGAVVATLWLVGPYMVTLLYGQQLRPAALLLNVLATGAMAVAAFGASSVLLIMTGHTRQAAAAALVSLALAVPPALVAVQYGPLPLALASAVASPILIVGQWLTARRLLGIAPMPTSNVLRALADLRGGVPADRSTTRA